MSPETPSSAVRLRVSKAESEVAIARVELSTVTELMETGAHARFCTAAAAVKLGALANSTAGTLLMSVAAGLHNSMNWNGIMSCLIAHQKNRLLQLQAPGCYLRRLPL